MSSKRRKSATSEDEGLRPMEEVILCWPANGLPHLYFRTDGLGFEFIGDHSIEWGDAVVGPMEAIVEWGMDRFGPIPEGWRILPNGRWPDAQVERRYVQ